MSIHTPNHINGAPKQVPSEAGFLQSLGRSEIIRVLTLVAASSLFNGCSSEPEEVKSTPSQVQQPVVQPPVEKCDEEVNVYIEVINAKAKKVNAPFQLIALQGAATMTCWNAIGKPVRQSRRSNEEGAADRKILVAPPEQVGSDAENSQLVPWHLFYVVDDVVRSQIRIVPNNVNEPLDVFLKRAMEVLYTCSFNEQRCEKFNFDKAKGGKFPVQRDQFQLKEVRVPRRDTY